MWLPSTHGSRLLPRLVGKTPGTDIYGSHLSDVYCEKMTLNEKRSLSSVIHMTQKLGRMPCLRDSIAVIDEENLHTGDTLYHVPSLGQVPWRRRTGGCVYADRMR